VAEAESTSNKMRKPMSPKKVAVYGVSIALVAALTYIGFPITPTRGYFNFGEVAIFFIAFMIGWREAAICGAIGATMIDLILAPFFAPATLVAKAIEGALAGMIIIAFINSKRPMLRHCRICKHKALDVRDFPCCDCEYGGGNNPRYFINIRRPTYVRTAAFLAGGSLMIITYFLYEWLVLPLGIFSADVSFYSGIGPALAELPFNIVQAVACGVLAMMLAKGIERAYPRIADFRD
jgi:uncharacterized membrane protein